jgi:hypothetical protein
VTVWVVLIASLYPASNIYTSYNELLHKINDVPQFSYIKPTSNVFRKAISKCMRSSPWKQMYSLALLPTVWNVKKKTHWLQCRSNAS